MNEVVYNSIVRYFSTLSSLGYVNYEDVNNLLFLIAIHEFIYNDFRGFITEDDYREIERVLYKIFGTSCLIPYPEFCKNNDMNKLHLGDISELAYRVEINENNIKEAQNAIEVNKDNIREIQNTKVVKASPSYEKMIEDIIP